MMPDFSACASQVPETGVSGSPKFLKLEAHGFRTRFDGGYRRGVDPGEKDWR